MLLKWKCFILFRCKQCLIPSVRFWLFVGYPGSMILELFQIVHIPLWHSPSHWTPYRELVRGAVAARFHVHHPQACSMTDMALSIMKTSWQSIFSRLWKCFFSGGHRWLCHFSQLLPQMEHTWDFKRDTGVITLSHDSSSSGFRKNVRKTGQTKENRLCLSQVHTWEHIR